MNKLIGNTPMIKITYKYKNKIKDMYAKLEYYNYTGSIKDRIADYIINESYKDGSLKKGMPIIEATSGNTGISFSALGRLYNHSVHIFMPDWVSSERINIMKMYGANVYLVSKEEGGFKECIKRADELSKKINGFRPNQFDNIKNIEAHYNTTGKEIINSLNNINGFVSGIGTGGTLMGVSKRLKEYDKNIKIIVIEPDKLPILSKGINEGSHKIEGIGDDFIPSLVDKDLIDKVIDICDDDAINMSRLLSRKFGLGVGISSGANFLGCVLSDLDNVVTVFTDDMKKYLSTDLSKDINKDKNLISNNIELISIKEV
mgnify:FL=1